MKVQKGFLPDSNQPIWMVLGDDYLPIEPIQKYLHYLDSVERSPNTLSSYAHSLKLYWEFLQDERLDWHEVNLENIYVHLTDEDLMLEYQNYLDNKEKINDT